MNLDEYRKLNGCPVCNFFDTYDELREEIDLAMDSEDPPGPGVISDYLKHRTEKSLLPEKIRTHFRYGHGK